LQSRLHLTSYVDDGGRQGFGGEGFETQRHRGTERGEVGERTEERGEVGERTEERGKVGERTEERGEGEKREGGKGRGFCTGPSGCKGQYDFGRTEDFSH
jgi:hypothetical protein